jgi:uncharacterized protein YndB with AHSA1/START domain
MAERHSCTVAGTPDDVFAFITDQSRLPEWNPAIVSSKLVDPPLREGATLEQVRRQGSKQSTDHFEVAEHDPPRRHRVRGEVGGVNVAIGFELEPVEGGTKVTESFDWSTARVPLAIELMGYPKKHPANMTASLERLAALVES